MTIALYEDFADPLGQFHNYDTYNETQEAALAAQKHVDIRSFIQTATFVSYTMLDLDRLALSILDALTISDLESALSLSAGEAWSAGTVAPQSDRNHFNGISLTCNTGTTTTQSVLTFTVDISGVAGTSDYISIACPALPAQVTLATSYLDLTSHPSGNFATGPTDSLTFSTATVNTVGSDKELRWPVSALTHINLRAITGIRFRITTGANVIFRCLAIRAMAADWTYAPVDQNTLYGYLAATVPPSGSLSQAYTFPGDLEFPSPTLYPSPDLYPSAADWPVAIFTDGQLGPMTTTMDVGLIVHTGSGIHPAYFIMYFHEYPMLPYDMTTLESLSMSALEALPALPEFIPEHLDNVTYSRWLAVSMSFGVTKTVAVTDETGNGWTLDASSLANATDYYFRVIVEDTTVRALVYPADAAGNIDFTTIVFDSTLIDNPVVIPRRPGRFGWFAYLGDGDTNVRHLRPRKTVYKEYRSAPFVTTTPTMGARIYPSATPDRDLLTSITNFDNADVSADVTRSRSNRCYRVQTTGALDGLTTNPIRFEQLPHTEISFDLLAPAETDLAVTLFGEGRAQTLFLPAYIPNRWTHIAIPLDVYMIQPAAYNLVILQQASAPSTWYLDNLSVTRRAVAWEGRQAPRYGEAPWLPFGDLINDPFDGLVVGRGTSLQIRGLVLAPDADIHDIKILPQYAQLGNLVWDDEQPTFVGNPTAVINRIVAGRTVTVQPNLSTSPNAALIAYYWDFGDGTTLYGPITGTTHTYANSGDYTITLTVVDALDFQASSWLMVTV